MPPNMPPPQGALSAIAGPPGGIPGPAMPPAGPPAGPPPVGPAGPAALPGAPLAGQTGPPVKPPKPGNEGLVNRVLGLVSGETQQQQRMAHQQQLAEALKHGAQQGAQGAMEGFIQSLIEKGSGLGQPGSTAGTPGGGSTDAIRGLMAQAGGGGTGMPEGGGLARGGFPFQYLAGHPGLPVRAPFATGGSGGNRFVPPDGMSGRSDKVEARLSPNEYVVDAETMGMLGDGSPDAGAKKMDRFRANVRRHKGKALAKGKFSPDAREPESYL